LKTPRGQIVVAEPTAVVALETQRMLARASDGQITQIGDAQWSDALPKLIQEKIIESFENAGLAAAVLPPVEHVTANYQLLIDLRSFGIKLGPQPTADVEFSAKVVAEGGNVAGAQLIHASVPAPGTDTPAVAAALNQAFGKAATDLVTWAAGII
jgi:phospholipid/cholesterol/gamma-HCH transport system substrate-binding protein